MKLQSNVIYNMH